MSTIPSEPYGPGHLDNGVEPAGTDGRDVLGRRPFPGPAAPESHSSLGTILRIARRRLWVIAIFVVLVPAAALAFSLSQERLYSSSAFLLFRAQSPDQQIFGDDVPRPDSDPERDAATNVKVVELNVIAARTARRLRGRLTPEQVDTAIDVEAEGQSDLVSITATADTPELAARLANAYAGEVIAFRRDADRARIREAQRLVRRQLAALSPGQRGGIAERRLEARARDLDTFAALQTGNAELAQRAERPPPGRSSYPQPRRDLAIGLFAGLVLGALAAGLLEQLDRRLKDVEDIESAHRVPIVGKVPKSRAIARSGAEHATLEGVDTEAFAMLRANLRYFNVDREVRSVLVTSAAPEEGKTTIAWNTAVAAARTSERVLFIEADLRRPTKRLGLPAASGLSLALAGMATVEEMTSRVIVSRFPEYAELDVLPAGPLPPNPAALTESRRMRELVKAAEAAYDLVVIDTPPVGVASDAIPLMAEVSGVILVSRLGVSRRDEVAALQKQLEQLDAPVMGVVVNGATRMKGSYYGYLETPETTQ